MGQRELITKRAQITRIPQLDKNKTLPSQQKTNKINNKSSLSLSVCVDLKLPKVPREPNTIAKLYTWSGTADATDAAPPSPSLFTRLILLSALVSRKEEEGGRIFIARRSGRRLPWTLRVK
jgi:hypothetical protein